MCFCNTARKFFELLHITSTPNLVVDFSTASIIQAGVSSGANYMVKKSTGKTISEHAFDAINNDTLKQTYLPQNNIKVKTKVKRISTADEPILE